METIAGSATHLLGIINDIISLKAMRTMNVKQDLVGILLGMLCGCMGRVVVGACESVWWVHVRV